MKQPAVWLILLLAFVTINGCTAKDTALLPAKPTGIAIMTIDDQQQQEMEPDEGEILDQVMIWLDQDIIRRLRDKGLEITQLKDIKRYSSSMGPLVLVNVEAFNAGIVPKTQRKAAGGSASSLELSYKLLDERGVVLAEWQDGAESIKGGTYCARDLNLRAVEKIAATFDLR